MKKSLFILIVLVFILILLVSCKQELDYINEGLEEEQGKDEIIQEELEGETSKEYSEEVSNFDDEFIDLIDRETNFYKGLRFETKELELSRIQNSFPRLVCLGDSVTFGWNQAYTKSYPFLLENRLKEQYPEILVVNSGVGGETVVDGLSRLDSDVFYFNPQVVIINFGLNDAFVIKIGNEDTDLINYIDLDTYIDTYKQLIERILEKDIKVLIMSTNPTIPEKLWQNKDIANKLGESYKIYNQAAKAIAEDYDLIFVDIWDDFMTGGKLSSLLQPDSVLHPNEKGLILISEILANTLGSKDLADKEE